MYGHQQDGQSKIRATNWKYQNQASAEIWEVMQKFSRPLKWRNKIQDNLVRNYEKLPAEPV